MYFLLSIILIVLSTLNQLESAWNTIINNKKYYVSYPDKANWFVAKRFCSYNRLYLVDVVSPYENDRIISLMDKATSDGNVSSTEGGFWTSGSDLAHKGRYSWALNGDEIIYSYWAEMEPFTTSGDERCIMYLRRNGGRWSLQSCETNAWFICRDELDATAAKETQYLLKPGNGELTTTTTTTTTTTARPDGASYYYSETDEDPEMYYGFG